MLEAYSVSHGKASAWLPVLEVLHSYFGIEGLDDAPSRRGKLSAKLAALNSALSDTLPYLFGLLGIQKSPRRQSAKSWELVATMSLARLLVSQGRCDEARAMVVKIYNWFTEGFDTSALKGAKALLDELLTVA